MKPDYLLLSCCAPCCVSVVEFLKNTGRSFGVVFYNPNIFPKAEYIKRRDENQRVCRLFGVPFIELPYEPEAWQREIVGLENCPEQGQRCALCFRMRLKKVAVYAAENNIKTISSVLGVSRYKNWNQVKEQAKIATENMPVHYDETLWRKGGLENRRHQLIRQLHLYTQSYCGCPYSQQKFNGHTPIQNPQS